MDNSLHELGEAYDWRRLMHWLHELCPNEFIVPDEWMDYNKPGYASIGKELKCLKIVLE